MGHRANLLLVRDGRYDLRYSHWAANTLTRDLFWGPHYAIAFVEAQPVAGTDWLDDVWAEGGSVIDANFRVFRLFGGEDLQYDVPLRRLYIALLGVVWQGWSIGWADEGIAELADYVGYPRDQVLTREHHGIPAPDLRPPEESGWVDFVGSVRLSDGSLRLFPMAGDLTDYLMTGPRLAESAVSQQGLAQLSLAEWTSEFPKGGFHLDLRSNDLRYWTSGDQPGVSVRIATRWPKWSTTWLRDRYEDQLTVCGGLLSFPDRTPEALFADLRSMLLRQPTGSPADTVQWFAEQERAKGKVVEVNTNALRDDRVDVPIDARNEILHRAAVQLGLSQLGNQSWIGE